MPIGSINTYATTDKSPNYLGQAISELGDISFRDRQEKKQDEEKKQRKIQDESNGYGSPEFKAIATNNSSINDLTSKQAVLARQKFLEFKQKTLYEDDPVKKSEYIQGMQRVKNSFDYSSQFPIMLNKIRADIVEGKEKGVYDEMSANENLNSADQLNKGQANLRYDDSGNIRFDVYDKDGKILNENQTFESYISSLNPLKKSTYNDDVLKFASKYKIDETTTKDMSGREIIDQRVDRSEGSKDYDNALEYAQGILSRENERKIIAREHNIDVNDDKKLEEFVVNDLLNGLQSKYSDKQDTDLIQRKAEFKYKKAKDTRDEAKENPEFGKISVSVSKNAQILGDVKAPVGTKKISYSGLINGDPKKAYQQMTDIAVVKTKKGFVVTGKVKSFGGENVSTKETKYKQSYYDKLNWLKNHPNASDTEKEKNTPDETDILSETTTQKQIPSRYIRFGKNATEVAEFLKGKNMTVDELQRQAIIDAGYNPDEKFNKKEIEKEKTAEELKKQASDLIAKYKR
jgi:hypothetical protein